MKSSVLFEVAKYYTDRLYGCVSNQCVEPENCL